MLRLSVAMEEWLKIGEDINIIFLGMTETQVKIMIDAPTDIPVSRNRAMEKYLSVEEYEKRRKEIKKEIKEEKDGYFETGKPVELSLWLKQESHRQSCFGIYGKGRLARECYNAVFVGGTQKILAYVNPQRSNWDCNVPVQEESALLNPQIDYVLVAIKDAKSYRGIVNMLTRIGVLRDKIIWVPEV